jgi:acetyl esterase/lipase
VVSIDYRKRPVPDGGSIAVPVPEAVQDTLDDAVAAVQWIHANAAALRIDPASVVAAGYSAGAITALGLAHKATAATPAGGPPLIAAVLSFSGLDLHGDPPSRPDDPPVLMVNGEQDTIVPIGAANFTCRATVLAGSECDQVRLPDEGHTPGDHALYQRSVEWLAAHGISQLAACPTFDVPTVDYTTTTTTSTPTTSTTTPEVEGTDDEAPPAVPVRSTPTFTG